MLPGWANVEKSKIQIQDISGLGGSKTFIVSCEKAEPLKVILHSRDLNISDAVQEKRQEKIQRILSDLKLGPTRLYYGSDWNIESFYGNSKSIG